MNMLSQTLKRKHRLSTATTSETLLRRTRDIDTFTSVRPLCSAYLHAYPESIAAAVQSPDTFAVMVGKHSEHGHDCRPPVRTQQRVDEDLFNKFLIGNG
jgi:hypothetical protein